MLGWTRYMADCISASERMSKHCSYSKMGRECSMCFSRFKFTIDENVSLIFRQQRRNLNVRRNWISQKCMAFSQHFLIARCYRSVFRFSFFLLLSSVKPLFVQTLDFLCSHRFTILLQLKFSTTHFTCFPPSIFRKQQSKLMRKMKTKKPSMQKNQFDCCVLQWLEHARTNGQIHANGRQ